jgi:epoxyqueuosine reductase
VNRERQNKQELKKSAHELGFDLFGLADVTAAREEFNIDKRLKERFDRGISLGKKLIHSILEDIADRPTALYFHHYRQVNYFLDRAAFDLSSRIQDMGYGALPIAASQIIDWRRQQAHLSHKKVGRLAGIGWLGRNNLLVNPIHGARFRLVTVLTNMPLEPDMPLESDCGECRQCLSCCPAGAIKEKKEDFDHLACFEKLKEFRRSGLVGQFICGICVKACRGPRGQS